MHAKIEEKHQYKVSIHLYRSYIIVIVPFLHNM